MSHNTWHQRLDLEVLRPNWNHVAISIGEERYFLNYPIVWDNSLPLGTIILEPNTEAIDAAKRGATSN